jgi:hypothetical protein
MISKSSIDNLMAWRRETMSRLVTIREQEALLNQTFKSSASALRQARYKGKAVSWEDRVAVLQMCEDIVTGVARMLTMRSTDLELLLTNIDKLAREELPPGVSWEWPPNSETREH